MNVGPIDPDERIEVSVTVRPRRSLEDLGAQLSKVEAGEQTYMSREEYAAAYGADASDLAKVEDFAKQHHLEVVESSPARRTVVLAGRAADIASAFGVAFTQKQLPDGTAFRGYTGEIALPAELQGIVEGVFGLDTRPIARRGAS